MPALTASVRELQAEVDGVLAIVEGGQAISIHSGADHVLRLQHGDRVWSRDDGRFYKAAQGRGAMASNLPAGSVYTTVLETETEGSLWLPKAGEATDVVFHFAQGRAVRIEAASGAQALNEMLDNHTGEPRRVSHVGLGLNPYLHRPIGWTLVDEHIHGALFIAFGENRYMGGQNESSLNIDFTISCATLEIDGRLIVREGDLVG
jgi:leucyl aminopeptidase (aminopeptidase T)